MVRARLAMWLRSMTTIVPGANVQFTPFELHKVAHA